MTVAELIKILFIRDPDALVVFPRYEWADMEVVTGVEDTCVGEPNWGLVEYQSDGRPAVRLS